MVKDDARYQKLEHLQERRKQIARLQLRSTGVMQIVALTGLIYPTMREAADLFVNGGGRPSNLRRVAAARVMVGGLAPSRR